MDWKKFGKRLLFPSVWLLAMLVPLSAVGLVTVFARGWEQKLIAYPIYVLSFYSLTAVTVRSILRLPKGVASVRERIRGNPVGNRYLTDRVFRASISLEFSLGISVLYVGINLWSWYTLKSWWFMVLAVYYSIMALMRFLLLRRRRTGMAGEWKRTRTCAYLLLLINLSLSGAVLMILYQSKGYDYPGIMIYVMALYTFYAFTHAVVDIVRSRKLGSLVMTTAKIVSLSGALVSMLNLETAMFAQFGGDMEPIYQKLFIILTGAGVSICVVAMSLYLIGKATKEIGRIQNGTK